MDAIVRRALLPRLLAGTLAGTLAGMLAGCGGGLFIGIGDDFGDPFDEPPRVTLVTSVTTASPGDIVRLAAAASDDRGVEQVAFYRLEPDGRATLLGAITNSPYDWQTVVPAGQQLQVRYFARATDTAGQQRDSTVQTVTLP